MEISGKQKLIKLRWWSEMLEANLIGSKWINGDSRKKTREKKQTSECKYK